MKIKSFLCLLLCLTLTLSALGIFSMEASAATRTGADLLDSYTTSTSKTYVLDAIDYYLTNNTALQSAAVVFMFEGASKSPAAYSYGGTRNQAIAVVVSSGAIIYVEGNCSAIPDCPDKDYNNTSLNTPPSSASVKDGVYKLINHDRGFQVVKLDGTDGLPCVRLNKSTGEYVDAPAGNAKNATAILIHNRSAATAAAWSDTWARSTGCMLVGANTSAFSTFESKVKAISGTRYFVLDRHLAISALNSFVYGNYSKGGSYNAVEVLTANSKNAYQGGSGAGTGTGTGTKPTISLDSIGTVNQGSAHNITGTVSSSTNLTSVKGEILSGSTVKQSHTVYPNAATLNLKSSAINTNLKFGTLAAGSYTLKITAVNAAGTSTKSVSFTIAGPADTVPAITLNSIGTVTYGNACNITGTVSSSSTLTSVKGEILSGTTVKQSYTVKPNVKTLNLKSSAINTNLKFGSLAVGSYTLKITAKNSAGTTTKSISFNISSNLKISVDSIGNVSYGSSHNITGTVSSAAKLTSVKGEILSGSTVKQSVTVTPNAKTLNLKTSNINYKLKFGTLARGTYTLRITAKDATGTTKTVSITFKIV